MNETIKEWLKELYIEEIKQEEGTIKNERLWANGCEGEEAQMHIDNIELHEEYIRHLNTLLYGLD